MTIERFATIPYPRTPVNNVTPFTYRDGFTYLEVIEALRDHVNNNIVPTLQGNVDAFLESLDNMHTAFLADLNDYNDRMVDNVQEFNQIHNAYMADVNASLMALNDPAVASLVGNHSSALFTALSASFDSVVVLRGSGIDLTGVVDSTAALTALYEEGISSGARKFVGVSGATYKIATPLNGSVFNVVADNVSFDLSDSTIDNTMHTSTDDVLATVWTVDGAKNFSLSLAGYEGSPVTSPTVNLGYHGATLVRAINGSSNINVDASNVNNIRYGVNSGSYSTASLGMCSRFNIKISGTMIGYPVAVYRGDDITVNLNVDGVHRAAYFAGCDGVRGTVNFRNQYVAPVAVLLSDCLTSGTDAQANIDPVVYATTSRGTSNVDLTVIDTGSTISQPSSVCAGIALSRLDPHKYENIRLKVYVTGTDQVSTRMGGFHITPGNVSLYQPRYTTDWTNQIVFDNIEISGVVDHSAQTLPSNAAGEIYMTLRGSAADEAAGMFPAVRNLSLNNLTILRSPADSPRHVYIMAPGIQNAVKVDQVYAPGLRLVVYTNPTVSTVVTRSRFGSINTDCNAGSSSVTVGEGTVIDTNTSFISPSNVSVSGGEINGGGAKIKRRSTILTLTGSSVQWSSALAIPAGAILLGVQGVVREAIVGSAGFSVGIPADLTRFADVTETVVGTVIGPDDMPLNTVPLIYTSNTPINVSSKVSDFTAGKIELVIHYISMGTME